ncbi:MAG: radical SAM protein [Bacteroidales bacterium]|nr:radical SAM protein [Bacteroidales bacterium]
MLKRSKIKSSLPKEILQEYNEQYGKDKVFCRAPFNSLRFFQNGETSACCLNRFYFTYGSYKNNSLKDILKSKERKLQQKHIKRYNLELGCDICQENMISKNFLGVMANIYKQNNIRKHLTRIDFELSHKCNLNCIMCSLQVENKENPYNELFIEDIKPHLRNLEIANFIGGEPFVIDLYYKIWDYIIKENKNCIIRVITNATILNEDVLKIIRYKNSEITVSIDSIIDETYEKIRVGAKFENVLSNFKIINKIMLDKGKTTQITICPIILNAFEIPQLVDFANKERCRIAFNYTVFPHYLSLKYQKSILLKELIEHYKLFFNKIEITNDLIRNNINIFSDLINLLKAWYIERLEIETNPKIITKSIALNYIKTQFKEPYPEYIYVFENKLPESWEVSKSLFDNLQSENNKNELYILSRYNYKSEDIVKYLAGYFELPIN